MQAKEQEKRGRPSEEDDTRFSSRRRDLLKAGIGVALAALVEPGPLIEAAPAPVKPEAPPPLPPLGVAEEDMIVRMQRDLERALRKPVDQRRWGMVIDLRMCTGCTACVNACRAENVLPPGVSYRVVLEEEQGTYPNVHRFFLPRPCMQCEKPACTQVCPVSATYKRPDGIVAIDYDKCIGCRYCITACPYGARSFDFGEYFTANVGGWDQPQSYETRPTFEYGQKRGRKPLKSPIGNARKCTFCLHRLNEGMLPACITTCIGRASFFGDANDPDSLVAELMSQAGISRLKEEAGTRPQVYYIR